MHLGARPITTPESESSVACSYPSVACSYPSVACSYASVPVGKESFKRRKYEFVFFEGNMAISSGMMTRLCQEGHIFKMLIFGGDGFRDVIPEGAIHILKSYAIPHIHTQTQLRE